MLRPTITPRQARRIRRENRLWWAVFAALVAVVLAVAMAA